MKIPEVQGFQVALGHIRCVSQVERLISASITQQVEVVDQFFGEEFFSPIFNSFPQHFKFNSFPRPNASIQLTSFTSIHPQHFKFISFPRPHFNSVHLHPQYFHPRTTLQHFKSILQNRSSNSIHSLQYDGLVKRRSPRLRQPITTRDKQLFTAGACGRQLRYRGLLSKLRAVIVKVEYRKHD